MSFTDNLFMHSGNNLWVKQYILVNTNGMSLFNFIIFLKIAIRMRTVDILVFMKYLLSFKEVQVAAAAIH